MDVFRITYRVGPNAQPRELQLDVRARRWSARAVVQTVIKHEFPDLPLPKMTAGNWKTELVLGYVGITDLTCTYVNQEELNWTGHVTENGIVISTGTICTP